MDHTIAVTGRDVKRYELLKQVLEGKVSLAAAAPALGVSYRQAKRLKRKADAGLAALAHGNRGHPPANKLDQELRARVITWSQERYADFNDTHFTEMLAQREGLTLSRETVRCWRRQAGIKPKCRRRAPQHRRRRERKSAAGGCGSAASPERRAAPRRCCGMAAPIGGSASRGRPVA